MLTYVGKGYTPAFVQQFDAVIAAINHGGIVEIVAGPDVICTALENEEICAYDHPAYCHAEHAMMRDEHALREVSGVLGPSSVMVGSQLQLTSEIIQKLRQQFTSGTVRTACKDCDWHSLCTEVAAAGYAEAKLI